ncbi:phosphoenolpyruvate--protein phosphotransferase [Hwanghaeella sp.]|uniref:phosphoenolpyruvate--protein phosphotransferase n=1 Tax=Hwanghaeella sp. TaxID=2605943 RepID=UPI003CCBACB8
MRPTDGKKAQDQTDQAPPEATEAVNQMATFLGVGVAPGIVIGPARVIESGSLSVPEYALKTDGDVDADVERLERALAKSRRQLKALRAKSKTLPPAAAEEMGYLLDAHGAMLDESRLVRGFRRRIQEGRINAEAAVQTEVTHMARGFEQLDDPYIAARATDVREVGGRVLRNLMERKSPSLGELKAGTILIAEEITPADTAQMDPAVVGGFAAVLGGAEGHAAIMARSLGLPAVLGAAGLLQNVKSGDTVIVDGQGGRIVVNPNAETTRRYEDKRAALLRETAKLERLRDVPGITADGAKVTLLANLELVRDAKQADAAGAEGIGLLRTEFMFMNRSEVPNEDEQYQTLSAVVKHMAGRPVTIRTLDIGGEKLAYSLGSILEAHVGDAVNPALGVRAIRLSLREPKLFEAQLCAILRAAAHGPVRILLPMITTPGEVKQVRDIVTRLWQRLQRRGVDLPEKIPPIGVMIEIPGAALAADALAQTADFFAIGSNDLTMYTLAIDRADERVAHLYNPLHPAVLRLIEFTVQAALRARIPVSICGEIAGDPRFTPLLLGFGVRELSMSPMALARVKQRILKLDTADAARRARLVMEIADSGRIAALLDDMNGLA